MTGELESLVYTECGPGESLSGEGGFGFQAASPSAGAAVRDLVANHLLHEADPLQSVPSESLAHIAGDGWFATAKGTYLGPTGGGDANHLTHTVASMDPAAYSEVRPAQLIGSGFWLTEPVPPGPTEPIGPNWSPGLPAQVVVDFIEQQDHGTEWLTALHSILSDEQDLRRITFIGDDLRLVCSWIAAVTLLLPQSRALGIGFKLPVLDPLARSAHRIVSVTEETAPEGLSAADPYGMHVFDLRTHEHSLIYIDPASQGWVSLLERHGPGRLAEAVEFAASSDLPPSPAVSLAAACIFGEQPPRRDAGKVANWLVYGSDERFAQYGRTLTKMLLEYPDPPYDLLVALDDLCTMGRLPGCGADIRLALLEHERRDVTEVGIYRPDRLDEVPADEWNDEHHAKAVRLLTETLNSVHPDRFHLVLRLADRFKMATPGWDPATVTRFIAWWADHPHLSPDPSGGPGGAALRERLHAVLRHKCEADDIDANRIGREWSERVWLWFDAPDLDDALYCASLSYMMAGGADADRLELVSRHLDHAAESDLDWVSRVLWRRCAPNAAELDLLAERLPAGARVDQELFTMLCEELLHPQARLQPVRMNTAAKLIQKELLDNSDVALLVSHDATLRGLATEPGQTGDLLSVTDYLVETPQLLRLHESTVIDSLSQTRDLHAILSLLHLCSHAGQDRYAMALIGRLNEPSSARDLFTGYIVITRQLASGSRIRRLETILHDVLLDEADPLLKRTIDIVGDFNEQLHKEFTDYAADVRARAQTPLVKRILGPLLGDKPV